MAKTDIEQFILDEVQKNKGVMVPVRAGLFERLLVRKLSVKRMHPNPEDEFCFPDIGPNLGIISSYVSQFKENIDRNKPLMDEPLFIQKVRPAGYMLLNGHHRWAAALRLGIRRVPVNIVNGVFESDIRVILEKTEHKKRATIDLDEVIFRSPKDPDVEKLPGIFNLALKKKRLRVGIPALFSYLKKNGYDIWVYCANYYSTDDVQRYFKRYSAGVDVVITGMNRKRSDGKNAYAGLDSLIAAKYETTLHIDNEMLLITHGHSGQFEEVQIECEPKDWSREVITKLEDLAANEKK